MWSHAEAGKRTHAGGTAPRDPRHVDSEDTRPAAAHGHTIAHAIEKRSEEVLQVEHGSLYPALHRLEDHGLIASFWGTSDNNRRARYYRITPKGRAQLAHQTSRWDEIVRAVNRIRGGGSRRRTDAAVLLLLPRPMG